MYRVYKNKNGKLVLPRSNMMTGTFGTRNVVEPNWTIANGMVLIGEGQEGRIHAAFINNNMKNLVAIKHFYDLNSKFQPDEYFSKSLYKFIPEHVPNVRSYNNKVGRLISNMYRGGSALDWLAKNAQEVDDNIMRSIILQVVGSLHRLSLLDPSFRHNDLHLGNVFIDDRYFMPKKEVLYKYQVPYFDIRAVIADFGYAADKVHPLDPFKEVDDYGIVRGNDKMYDTHFFLSATLGAINRLKIKAPQTVAFLERAVPADYRGKTTRYVENFRLAVGVKYPKSFDDILGDKYFKDHLKPGKPAATKRLNLGNTSKKPKSPAKKKPASPRVMFSRANKEKVALRKIELVRRGMNNVEAEMRAIKNVETLKKAGLLTPSPSGNRVLKPVTLGPAVATGGGAAEMNKKNLNEFIKKMNVQVVRPAVKTIAAGNNVVAPTFTQSPGGRIRIGSRLCMSLKKDELVTEAKKAGVSYAGTKDAICKRLLKGKGPANVVARSPIRSPAKTAAFAAAKSPGGRIRIGRKLCSGFKKEELVAMAKQAGVSTSGTKEDICNRLVKGNLRSNIKGFINRFPSNQTLTRRKIREYIYGRHGNVNNNTFKALVSELTNKKSPPRRMKKLANAPSEIM